MKADLYNIKGEKKGEIELPEVFASPIREDIVVKYYETDKIIHPYSSDPKAGQKHSASGTISHKRHDWKGHYGRGISRVPRKTMWRRGVNFFWVGATAPGTRGGRRAHPPKGIGKEKKINKKEVAIAMKSGFAATGKENYVIQRYGSIEKIGVKVPVVIESAIDNAKTKDFIATLKKIFNDLFALVMQKKSIRAGKGTRRGRKYKRNAGLLLVIGSKESIKMKGIEIKQVTDVRIADLYPLGRLVIYTVKALEELESVGGRK